jgi:outer membrane receptor protein involved in Fe transport
MFSDGYTTMLHCIEPKPRAAVRAASLAAVLTAAAPAVFAEQASSPAAAAAASAAAPSATIVADAQALAPVSVTGHYDNGVGTSDAASQGIVRGERLTDLPLLRPGEVLETIPGMVVTQHSGDGKANQYFLRGYNLDHGTDFATFIDGVPVNMPSHAHGQGYTDLNYLIPELVNVIEYRKGPYFAEDGDFSSAGSARIKYVDSLERGVVDLTLGSFAYRRLLLAGSPVLLGLNQPSGPRLLGALELQGNDGPWTTPEGLRKLNGLVRVSDGGYSNGWSVDASYYQARWTSTDPVPLELIESGQLGRFSALDPSDGGNSGRAIVAGEWHQHDDAGYTSASAYFEHYRLALWSNFTFFELRPQTGDQFEQEEHRNIVGGQLVHGWQHTLLGNESTTEVGLQVRHDGIRVGLLNSQARVAFETVSDDSVSETSLGLYAQNTTRWTPWFRSLLGVRADRVGMDVTSHAAPANSGSASGTRISPKASLIFSPWQKTELFLDAGKGFHSNDARGVVGKVDATTGLPSTPVPALVGSFGEEVGLRTDLIPGLQTSMALWKLNSDSEIVYAADSAIGSTEPKGASKRYGFEWNNHAAIFPWLLVDADFAWTHARYAHDNDNGETGNYIANAVSKVALLGVTVHPSGPWSAGLVTRYVGAYPLSQDGSLVGPSALVTNLLVRRDFGPHATLTLEALNLFDRKYYDIAYEQDYRVSPSSPVVPNGVTVHPGEPREFRVTLAYKF